LRPVRSNFMDREKKGEDRLRCEPRDESRASFVFAFD
jgi:hypothetical protein